MLYPYLLDPVQNFISHFFLFSDFPMWELAATHIINSTTLPKFKFNVETLSRERIMKQRKNQNIYAKIIVLKYNVSLEGTLNEIKIILLTNRHLNSDLT